MKEGLQDELSSVFMDAIYQDIGLESLVNLASDFLENPVYIVDFSDRIIAACDQIRTSDTYMRPMVESGYLTDYESLKMRRTSIKMQIQRAASPFIAYRPVSAGGEAFILSPIRIQGDLVAYSCCMALNRAFQKTDIEYSAVVAKAFSIELQKSRIYQDTKGTKLGYQLLDAISSTTADAESYFHGWFEKEYSYLLVIPYEKSCERHKLRSNILLHVFREAFHGSIVALSDYGIVVLLTHSEPFLPNSEKYEYIEELLRLHEIRAGCSQRILDLKDFHQHYVEAQTACEIGGILQSESRITSYDNMFLYHMLQVCDGKIPLNSLCDPALIKLKAFDQKKNTCYYDTLIAYISTMRDIPAVTEKLKIHKNTLYYRLQKIEEITGISANNTDNILHLLITDKILNWQEHWQQYHHV